MNKPDKIILHHSATEDSGTVSWGAIRRFHVVECAWGAIGYHFGIELVGDYYEVLVGRLPYETGAHTQGQNSTSLGICFVGQFDDKPPPQAQWERGLWLCRYLISEFKIDHNEIHGHREYANKTCPGKMFDVELFKKQI
jgi:N-acetyl-anhydromuramyl-L-alanine amidase AmpD